MELITDPLVEIGRMERASSWKSPIVKNPANPKSLSTYFVFCNAGSIKYFIAWLTITL